MNNQSQFKLSILDIIYKELIKEEIQFSCDYLIRKIIENDDYFNQFSKYHVQISKMVICFIDLLFLWKWSGTIEEIYLNLLKIDVSNNCPINAKTNIKLLSYSMCFILTNLISCQHEALNPSLISIIQLSSNILHKCIFMFKGSVFHINLFDFIFNVMIIQKGNTNILKFKQVMAFIIYLSMKYLFTAKSQSNHFQLSKINVAVPKKNKALAQFKGKCMICKRVIEKNKIALRCCGVMCCLNCIEDYIINQDKCPVCENKLYKSSIIKLYS